MKPFKAFFLILGICISLFSQSQNDSMQLHSMDTFQILGVSARIANDSDAVSEIEALWETFWNNDIRNKIPNSISNDIYAVYTDYETDHTGPYTLIIGLPVKVVNSTDKEYTAITIYKDTYKKFISKGKMPEAVVNTWIEIWNSKDLNRSYRTDFTVHGEKYFDGENAEVETFISINTIENTDPN